MSASGLCFAYLPRHNVMSTILLCVAQLAWMHVKHISGWWTNASSVHNNSH